MDAKKQENNYMKMAKKNMSGMVNKTKHRSEAPSHYPHYPPQPTLPKPRKINTQTEVGKTQNPPMSSGFIKQTKPLNNLQSTIAPSVAVGGASAAATAPFVVSEIQSSSNIINDFQDNEIADCYKGVDEQTLDAWTASWNQGI